MKSWLQLCREFTDAEAIAPQWLECVFSFHHTAGVSSLRATTFESIEERLNTQRTDLPKRIHDSLIQEVDEPQSAMFIRRLETVLQRLDDLSQTLPAARLLRVGLLARIDEIVEGIAGLPRALRVRAAVDFFYSQSALLHHRQSPEGQQAISGSQLAEAVEWTPIHPKISQGTFRGHTLQGPQRIHLIRAEPGSLRMEVVDRRISLAQGLSLEQEARARSCILATSGGFFLYSEPDIEAPSERGEPVGLMMNGAEVRRPPVFRRATLAQTTEGHFEIEPQGLEGCRFLLRGRPASILAVNSPELIDHGAVAFTRAWTDPVPAGPQFTVVGSQIIAVSEDKSLPIPLNGFVLRLADPGAILPPDGGQFPLWLPEWRQNWMSAMAGGPMLVAQGAPTLNLEIEDFTGTAPPRTFSGDETGDQNLLPRMAAGLDRQGRLYLVAVDGRDFHQALGLSLGGLSELMIALGCYRAVNLDGGSSKRMVVQGKTVDHSSTDVQDGSSEGSQQRPVRTALFFSAR